MDAPLVCWQTYFAHFFILMHDRKSGVWVAKIAEQALVRRLPKAKTKNRNKTKQKSKENNTQK